DYNGNMWIGEYPRNQRLLCSEGRTSINKLKQQLNLPVGATTVLYAPTWRSKQRLRNKNAWDESLNLSELAKQTNSVLLVRAHHTLVNRMNYSNDAIDVSDLTNVEDLMLIADILITDYSSIAYDFMVTGKPVIHYAADEKSYAEERGTYADWLGSEAKIVRSEEELIEAVRKFKTLQPKSPINIDTRPIAELVSKISKIAKGNIKSSILEGLKK